MKLLKGLIALTATASIVGGITLLTVETDNLITIVSGSNSSKDSTDAIGDSGAENLYQEADNYMSKGDFLEALPLLAQYISTNSSDTNAQGKYSACQQSYADKVVQENNATIDSGDIDTAQKNLQDAIDDLEDCVGKENADPSAIQKLEEQSECLEAIDTAQLYCTKEEWTEGLEYSEEKAADYPDKPIFVTLIDECKDHIESDALEESSDYINQNRLFEAEQTIDFATDIIGETHDLSEKLGQIKKLKLEIEDKWKSSEDSTDKPSEEGSGNPDTDFQNNDVLVEYDKKIRCLTDQGEYVDVILYISSEIDEAYKSNYEDYLQDSIDKLLDYVKHLTKQKNYANAEDILDMVSEYISDNDRYQKLRDICNNHKDKE